MSETSSSKSAPDVELSIVIPIYNEEKILEESVLDLIENIDADPRLSQRSYEVILSENGSTDDTVDIARRLEGRFDEVRLLRTGEPNYGLALRRGIYDARGEGRAELHGV